MNKIVPFLSESDLSKIRDQVGEIISIETSPEGLVHWVYKIQGSRKTAYLKLRKNFFNKVPQIKTESSLIKSEVLALRLFHSYFPHIFPRILIFNQNKNYLLLSDITKGTSNFEYKLNTNKVKKEDFYVFGNTVGNIHSVTSHITNSIRRGGDLDFKNKQLVYLLGFLNHQVLNSVIEEHKRLPTNLILGDPSPKNIYIEGDQIGICDLENSHQGSRLFEQAHLIAHIIIHNLANPKVRVFVSEFLRGYRKSGSQINIGDVLFIRTVVGLLLYRLANPIIPYNIPIHKTSKNKCIKLFKDLLDDENISLRKLLLSLKIIQCPPKTV